MRAMANRCLLLLLICLPAYASAGPAKELVANMAEQAIGTLRSTEGDLASREARLRHILVENFDMDTIAKNAMGRYWSKATPDQKRSYVSAFSDYVVATYARRFGGYAGEELKIVSEREAGRGDVLVGTQIARSGGPPIEAEWRVNVDSGPAKVVDVLVENVSMAVTQRSEFASVIRRHGVDGLIQVLQARAGRAGAQK